MTIAVLVLVAGLIVGVAIEIVLGRRHQVRDKGAGAGRSSLQSEPETDTVLPTAPALPEPRVIEDGEGFRILGPLEYDDPGPGSWENSSEDDADGGAAGDGGH